MRVLQTLALPLGYVTMVYIYIICKPNVKEPFICNAFRAFLQPHNITHSVEGQEFNSVETLVPLFGNEWNSPASHDPI